MFFRSTPKESEHKNEAIQLLKDYDKIKAEDLSPLAIKFQNAAKFKFKRSWRINRERPLERIKGWSME
jgi:hypothetical protein